MTTLTQTQISTLAQAFYDCKTNKKLQHVAGPYFVARGEGFDNFILWKDDGICLPFADQEIAQREVNAYLYLESKKAA